MIEVKTKFQEIIDLCQQIEEDIKNGLEVNLQDLNDMIISYFPTIDIDADSKAEEAAEVSIYMKNIEKLLQIQRDSELERNLEEIESLRKYRKYMDVLDMVEEKKWK